MAAKGDGVIPDWPDEKSELIGALRRHVWTLSDEPSQIITDQLTPLRRVLG